MRIIMVPVADRPESIAALESALALASRLEAGVEAFHIRAHRDSRISLHADNPEDGLASGSAAARGMVERIAEAAGARCVRKLKAPCAGQVQWTEQVGTIERLMPQLGPFADLIAVSRPRRRASHRARAFLSSAILDSSRPVLVLPPRGARRLTRRVAIAWDRSHDAMRAVVAALPILRSASEVSIVASGEGKADGPKPKALQRYLSLWDVPTTLNQTRGARASALDDIEDHMAKSRSDLLVMGAYSRSRLRERLFGGVTDHVVTTAKFPVLLHHG